MMEKVKKLAKHLERTVEIDVDVTKVIIKKDVCAVRLEDQCSLRVYRIIRSHGGRGLQMVGDKNL